MSYLAKAIGLFLCLRFFQNLNQQYWLISDGITVFPTAWRLLVLYAMRQNALLSSQVAQVDEFERNEYNDKHSLWIQ